MGGCQTKYNTSLLAEHMITGSASTARQCVFAWIRDKTPHIEKDIVQLNLNF